MWKSFFLRKYLLLLYVLLISGLKLKRVIIGFIFRGGLFLVGSGLRTIVVSMIVFGICMYVFVFSVLC